MPKFMIIIILALLFSSCELTSPARYQEEMLVVSGYLIAGKAITLDNPIFIGKTISAAGGNLEEVIIFDAEVKLIADQDTFNLTFAFDLDQYENLRFGYICNSLIIEPETTYRLEVSALLDSQQVFASAETTVPAAADINLDYYQLATPSYGYSDNPADQLPEIPFEMVNDDFPIHFSLNSGEIIYSVYKFYCLEEFSTSLEYTQPFMGFTHLEEEDEDAYNSIMRHNLRENFMFWRYEPQQDENGNWFRLDEFYANGFSYYGRYRLSVYIVDQNYYTYLYHSESYLHGGIEGGIGYFGSVTGEDYFTSIIKE